MAKLKPTLWRTVRALMNPLRLRLLREVFRFEGEFCVRDFAKKIGVSESIASIYLRQLNARGLLGVRREQVKVFYDTQKDRSLPDSLELQSVLRTFLERDLPEGWEKNLMVVLKAFAHFNRLAIVTRLSKGPARLKELHEAVGCCVKTMYHHLRLLYSAGLIDGTFVCREETVFTLVPPRHPLACVLLKLTLGSQDKFAHYYNPPQGCPDDASLRVLARLDHGGSWRKKVKPKISPGVMPNDVRTALLEVET